MIVNNIFNEDRLKHAFPEAIKNIQVNVGVVYVMGNLTLAVKVTYNYFFGCCIPVNSTLLLSVNIILIHPPVISPAALYIHPSQTFKRRYELVGKRNLYLQLHAKTPVPG